MSNFRKGFLLGLAENGVTPRDLELFIEKRAANFQAPIIVTGGGLGETLGSVAKGMTNAFVDFPVAGSILGGGLAGIGGGLLYHNLLSKMTTDPEHDPLKQEKNEQIIKELKFQSDLIRRRRALGTEKVSNAQGLGGGRLSPAGVAKSVSMPQMPRWSTPKKQKTKKPNQ